jgi:hypothetical protein
MTLFYDDNGIQAPVASGQYELTDNMMEYSVSFKAANKPESIGHRLGIAFDNVNTADRSWMGLDNVRLATTTGVSDRRTNPNAFSLEQNYPNPYNPSTTIIYTLNSNGKVHLSVYDLLGKEVSVLVNGVQTQGKHEVIFSGNSLSNGVYFYRLQTDKEVITKKMTLMK